MHQITDDNGNTISHAGSCTHNCGSCHSDCGEKDHRQDALAILQSMQKHQLQQNANLDQMAKSLEQLGMADVAQQLRICASEFQKGTLRMSLAMTLVREHIKEEA